MKTDEISSKITKRDLVALYSTLADEKTTQVLESAHLSPQDIV